MVPMRYLMQVHNYELTALYFCFKLRKWTIFLKLISCCYLPFTFYLGNKIIITTTTTITTTASTAIPMTERGCKCKKEWGFQGEVVDNYCGNPQNARNRAWCKVVDDSCEQRAWGYCA